MSDWVSKLGPSERHRWESFVRHVREDTVQKMAGSAFVASFVETGEPDVQFAVELGLSIMMDKPIVFMVSAGAHVPERLRRVADGIIEIEGDLDTEAGQAEALRKLRPFIDRFPNPDVASSQSAFPPDSTGGGGG